MKNKNIFLGLAGGIVLGLLFYNFIDKKSVKTKKKDDGAIGGGAELEEDSESDEDIPTPMPIMVGDNFQDRPSPSQDDVFMPKPLPQNGSSSSSQPVATTTSTSAQIVSNPSLQPVLKTLAFDGNNFDLDVDLDV